MGIFFARKLRYFHDYLIGQYSKSFFVEFGFAVFFETHRLPHVDSDDFFEFRFFVMLGHDFISTFDADRYDRRLAANGVFGYSSESKQHLLFGWRTRTLGEDTDHFVVIQTFMDGSMERSFIPLAPLYFYLSGHFYERSPKEVREKLFRRDIVDMPRRDRDEAKEIEDALVVESHNDRSFFGYVVHTLYLFDPDRSDQSTDCQLQHSV